ncbi:hypothetical protein WJX72_010317 [[Myrmecia] bisecta]|uniref:Dolichol kinase n=1 Tax=[Myrmecia] bisecta TaxID=41462 RepID=A0AAW1PH59_9CHLO
MFLLRREVLETAVIATTACSLSYGLCSASGPGCAWTLATLSGLAVLAVAQDLLSLRLAKWHSYTSRAAGSEGVALGALALPWTFVGLLVHTLSRRADAGFAELALHDLSSNSAPGANAAQGVKRWRFLAVACLVLLVALLAVPMLPGPRVAVASSGASGSAASLSAAINATASAGGMHLVLTHLPNCFTVGEAMVVAQALALLTYDLV